MGDRTTQATTTSNIGTTKTTTGAAMPPPSKRYREKARVLYGANASNGSSVTNRSMESNGAAPANRSPWNIGLEFYDQRDSFTTTSSIDHDGYGIGPSVHPEEGSYAVQYQRRHERPRSSPSEKPSWMLMHEPPRNQHHNHTDHVLGAAYVGEANGAAQHQHQHGIWDRIKDALHLEHHDGSNQEARTTRQILIDVEVALAQREDLDATDIEVSVNEPHEVTLEGTVVDRHSKRIAEEVCEGIQGVRDVQNRLKIRDNDPTDANVVFVLPLALLGT